MVLDNIFIIFMLILFLMGTFYGFIELIKDNAVFLGISALSYWIFRPHIHTFFRKVWGKPLYKTIFIIFICFSFVAICLMAVHAVISRYSDKTYSPDGRYYAQVQEINAGAMTSFETSIYLTDTQSFLNNRKVILLYDGSLYSATLTWIDNKTFKISYNECTRPRFYKEPIKQWGDIKILYENTCNP